MQSRSPKPLSLLRICRFKMGVLAAVANVADEKKQYGKLPVDEEEAVLWVLEAGRVHWA